MSEQPELLLKLGDQWHNPHPYLDLVSAVVPSSSRKLRIEDALLHVYVASHYEFKSWHNPTKNSIYDVEIELCKTKKTQLEDKQKQEEEYFKKLCEKFEVLGGHTSLDEDKEEEKEEDEEEDDDVEVHAVEKDSKIQQKKGAQPVLKETNQQMKERLRREAIQLKQTKTAMAMSQQNLIDYQNAIEEIDKNINTYISERKLELDYINEFRKHIFAYEKNKDITSLIQGIDSALNYVDKK